MSSDDQSRLNRLERQVLVLGWALWLVVLPWLWKLAAAVGEAIVDEVPGFTRSADRSVVAGAIFGALALAAAIGVHRLHRRLGA